MVLKFRWLYKTCEPKLHTNFIVCVHIYSTIRLPTWIERLTDTLKAQNNRLYRSVIKQLVWNFEILVLSILSLRFSDLLNFSSHQLNWLCVFMWQQVCIARLNNGLNFDRLGFFDMMNVLNGSFAHSIVILNLSVRVMKSSFFNIAHQNRKKIFMTVLTACAGLKHETSRVSIRTCNRICLSQSS